jgi:hypothetical protein
MTQLSIAILPIFSSTYSCKTLFSKMDFIKSDLMNRLTDVYSAACFCQIISIINQISTNWQVNKRDYIKKMKNYQSIVIIYLFKYHIICIDTFFTLTINVFFFFFCNI